MTVMVKRAGASKPLAISDTSYFSTTFGSDEKLEHVIINVAAEPTPTDKHRFFRVEMTAVPALRLAVYIARVCNRSVAYRRPAQCLRDLADALDAGDIVL